MAKVEKKNVKKTNVKKEVIKKETVASKKEEKIVKNTNKKSINLWWLLGLILPPVGLVLYLVWRKNKKDVAKSIGTASLISAIIMLFFGMSFLVHTNSDKKPEVNEVTEWKEKFDNGETLVTVIASSTCPHCQNLKPIITASAKKYGYNLYFFEGDKLSDSNYKIVSTAVELEDYEGYVPYTFVITNKKYINSYTGEMTDSELTKFLKDSKVIK